MQAFVLAIEPLANIIRQSRSPTPVVIPNQQPKMASQCANDINIVSSRAKDYNEVRKLTAVFEAGAGAKLNADKTEILLVGRWKPEDRNILPNANIKSNIKILGVWFGPNAAQLNKETILQKIDRVIDFWRNIPMSFTGKKFIISSKILSQLYHVTQVTGMDADLHKQVQKRIT